MFVKQFFVGGLAHSSYLLGGANACAIVDPRRDVELYLAEAKAMGMKITHILETHLHADFVSGHMDLAEKTGAPIYAPKSAKCAFPHVAVAEGDVVQLDNLKIKVLETPGHTPEHVSYVVTDAARGRLPVGVFCGDTLFVGDVGRPDLFPGRAAELASKLYDSLHRKLLKLPDFCEVYPAHGAGSLCGRAMGAKRTSTIGYERAYNAALRAGSRKAFVESLTTNMPAAPDHFRRCSAINGGGPRLVRKAPALQPLPPAAFVRAMRRAKTSVLDTRAYDAFGGQHIPGAYHIDVNGNFATFAGWLLPPDHKILLVSADAAQAQEAALWLRRVGLDDAVGFLDGGMFAWSREGLPAAHVDQLSAEELHDISAMGNEELVLLDVRSPREFAARHIRGATNIPAPDLRTEFAKLDPSKPTVLMCSTGHRSSMGASLLAQRGFETLANLAGGMTGYAASGFIQECPLCVPPHLPRFTGQ